MVTGYTPLQVLLDMGLDGPGIGEAMMSPVTRRLVHLEESQAP